MIFLNCNYQSENLERFSIFVLIAAKMSHWYWSFKMMFDILKDQFLSKLAQTIKTIFKGLFCNVKINSK